MNTLTVKYNGKIQHAQQSQERINHHVFCHAQDSYTLLKKALKELPKDTPLRYEIENHLWLVEYEPQQIKGENYA